VSRRIGLARELLLAGATVAAAAADAGFHDQAHLTRHFRHHVRTTPARYAARRP
jgi:AraC-like DNA-binding protein